jgi:uncharacterized protein YecA (UPF0149 family)
MSNIFNGIIQDGVYATIGDCFVVKANSGNTVSVGSGRAWFNGTWTYNDSQFLITAPLSDMTLSRIDALVLEVNSSEDVRLNSIQFVQGTAASSPSKPTLQSTEYIHQYPLAYISRPANSSSISQAEITNCVGTSECPFVIGVLEVMTTDNLILQWQAEWDYFVGNYETGISEWTDEKKSEYNAYYEEMQKQIEEFKTGVSDWTDEQKDDFNTFYTNFKTETNDYFTDFKAQTEEFNNNLTEWVDSVKDIIGDSTAGKMQLEIEEIQSTLSDVNTSIEDIETSVGKVETSIDKIDYFSKDISVTTAFNEDGSITETYTDKGVTSNTVFNDDGSITTTVYKTDNEENILYTKNTVFNDDGSITETLS